MGSRLPWVPPSRRARELCQEGCFSQSGAACEQAEAEAVRLANELQAEYWSVSAKTGEWARGCRHVSVGPAIREAYTFSSVAPSWACITGSCW